MAGILNILPLKWPFSVSSSPAGWNDEYIPGRSHSKCYLFASARAAHPGEQEENDVMGPVACQHRGGAPPPSSGSTLWWVVLFSVHR